MDKSKQTGRPKKIYFEHSKDNGFIESYKINDYSDDLKKEIKVLRKKCIMNLKKGATNKFGVGIKLVVESPVYIPNWAKLNIDRRVPLRQYFGEDQSFHVSHNIANRWSYGVGSGSSTVGGDTVTTFTQSLTQNMRNICSLLTKEDSLICKGKYCRKANFNHVTILYYLLDSKKINEVNLNPHCDIEINSKNEVSPNNSQKPDTPTIVISFGCSKTIKFFKRYVEGGKFTKSKEIDELVLDDGDIFLLHPSDERVRKRKGDEKTSQFQHGVKCFLKRNTKRREVEYKVAISVCFRESMKSMNYSIIHNNIVCNNGKLIDNSDKTEAGRKRKASIEDVRKTIQRKANLRRINGRLSRCSETLK